MKKHFNLIVILVLASILLGACAPQAADTPEEPTSAPVADTPEAEEQPIEVEETELVEDEPQILYVNLTWHQHQPLYYKDADGIYTRPWVRVHATKDYLDMAEKIAAYEDVQVSFNLTPSLIRQINDLANGAKDIYWVLAEKPVSELTLEEKQFILERFFDANWDNIIARYPRYQALLDKRGGGDQASVQAALDTFTEQDFMDLQVWFNLAWFDPEYLSQEPLLALVEKGENFTQEDKDILFTKVLEVLQSVIPYHKELQDAGQIEVTTTPYAHPILPLIYDIELALIGNPGAEMPEADFSYPQDAETHLEISVEMYEENFGREVRGLWPGEGSVAQAIVPLVADAGYTFMQTGEPVLAKSLGIDSFTRDSQGFVQQPDDLYRPYYVSAEDGTKVAVFFRDGSLSDRIGFDYSGMDGEAAAQDLISHLEGIQADFQASGSEGPHIVSIILDGENAWEHYKNDGNDFFHALYSKFAESEVLETVTPSNYLEMFPEQRELDDLFPGAWFSPNYDTWIGEGEEAVAWDYLAQVRDDLSLYETGEESASEEAIAEAFDFMYLAEGSDWFWWYGADQDSGQDSYFDEGYRALLAGVYESLGLDVPGFVSVPVIEAQPVSATRSMSGIASPLVDGEDEPAWETAAFYEASEAAAISGMYTSLDEENLYLRFDFEGAVGARQFSVYFSVPGLETGKRALSLESESVLGFRANKLLTWSPSDSALVLYQVEDDQWVQMEGEAGQGVSGQGMAELALPLNLLGDLRAGDLLKFKVIVEPDGDQIPLSGPAQMLIPDLGGTAVFLEVQDPVGDDYGPGTYTYPNDAVFKDSVFDVQAFSVGTDSENLVINFNFVGPVENPWGSPIGLSLQTMDVYIDTDPGEGSGARKLLPGRNASLEEGFGWEYAIWAEGWTSQVVQSDPDSLEPKDYSEASSSMKIVVDSNQNLVTIRVPLSFLPEGDPATWAYAAAVLSQEGYPAEGVWRVRDVSLQSAQWVFGGSTGDVNHTRIIDLILPEGSDLNQTDILGDYPSKTGSLDSLTPDDFAQVPILISNLD
ncbi:MAG: glucodextranase DOMON-like domain-containing protein [Brevefilum sp.]|nr:glucodextranase DOMON-like domain-containing protein [Brevefilum sp.]